MIQGYTNADNPFGDEHLLDTFVWSKKLHGEGKHQLQQKELQTLQQRKMVENKVSHSGLCIMQLFLIVC